MSRVALISSSAVFEERLVEGLALVDADVDLEVERLWSDEYLRIDPTKVVDDVVRRGAVVAWIGPGMEPDRVLELADTFDRARPDICVVLAAEPSAEILERALRAGVRDVIDPHGPVELVAEATLRAVRAAERRHAVAAGGGPVTAAHRIITMVSPKGGSGKTTIASNLGVELSMRLPGQVAIADLDLQFGDVASALQLTPEHTVADVARAPADVDSTMLKVFLTAHPSGLFALCAPSTPAEADDVSLDDATGAVRGLAEQFAVTLVDTAGGLGEHTLAAMEIATDLVFVSTMDVGCVRSLRKAIDAIDQLGMRSQRRWFVLNRGDAKVGLDAADVEAAVGLAADATIASSRLVPLSMNQGSPIVESEPRSPVAKQLKLFAHQMAVESGLVAVVADRGGRRWRNGR